MSHYIRDTRKRTGYQRKLAEDVADETFTSRLSYNEKFFLSPDINVLSEINVVETITVTLTIVNLLSQ